MADDSRKLREERLKRSKGKAKSSSDLRAERLDRMRGTATGDQKVGGVLGVLGNLGSDLKDAAVNLPSGLWETANTLTSDAADAVYGDTDFERTRKLASDIADQYAYTYGSGSLGETLHRIGQHPLGPVLDAATVLTAGAGAAAKTAQVSRATTLGEAARALVTKADPGKIGRASCRERV